MKKIITKKFILPILLVGIFFTYSSAFALTTATVTATVTVQNISLSVGDGSVAYGTLAQNTTQDTCSSHLSDAQTITNNGNVAETFQIKGQDSANWTLAGTAGSDQYVQKFLSSACTTSFTGGTAMTTSYQNLATNIAASGTATLNLQINTPNPSSVFTSQSVDVLLLAIAY